ncbi:MAG: SprB repeat-containing protein, partial [Crocinitomicaceae bacterium]|nr:SprB repeat-containing protein [Crocinitomicaceae bacterium]
MTFRQALHKNILLLVILITSAVNSFSKDFFWINDSGNWHDGAHWSLSSGGSPAYEVPGLNDDVYLDKNSFHQNYSEIKIGQDTKIGSLSITSDRYPVIQGKDVHLQVTRSIRASRPFDLNLSEGGYLHLQNSSGSVNELNTFGVKLGSDVIIDGSWNLANHLILHEGFDLQINSGKLTTNGYTLAANSISAVDKPVQLNLSSSSIFSYSAIDLAEAENIGSGAQFFISNGSFTTKDKNTFDDSSWEKVTVICPNPPFQLDLNITSNYNGSPISCNGACDAEITIVASGTVGPFSYSFNNFAGPFTSQTVYPNLCAGTYSIFVTDSSQQPFPGFFATCTASVGFVDPVVISLPPPPFLQPTCPSTCDGMAFTSPSGGTSPLTTFWPNSGETTNNPVGLCTGDNPVIVTDANGCNISDIITILNPPAITPGETITPPSCNGSIDAEILLNPAGGNGGPYTFVWNPIPASGQGTNPGIGFNDGIINVSIFDVDGCQKDTSFLVVDPPVLTITALLAGNALCFGSCDGSASSNPVGGTGGYTFEWFNSVSGLTTGITDQNPNTLCAGSYYVIVTDASGCTDQSNTITINQPTALTANASATDVSCFGVCDGSTNVIIGGGTPGYNFNWTTVPGGAGAGATQSLVGLCPGQYQINATDNNGCPIVPIIVEVFEPTPVSLTLNSTQPTCYDLCDGSATVVGSGGVGGFTYLWAPAPGIGQFTPNATAMCDGVYTMTVTDLNGCFHDTTFTLTNPAVYDISTSQTNLLCFGDINGTIDITVNSGGSGAGYTYTWAPVPPIGQGTPNVSGLSAGLWTVTIEDPLLCDTVLTFNITSPSQLTVNASVIANVSCFGDCDASAQVVAAGGTPGYTISWNDPGLQSGLVASNLCDGNFIVTVTDQNLCQATDNITITEPGPFLLDTSYFDIACFDACNATATVTMLGGGAPPYDIIWNDPLIQTTFTAFNLCAGIWTAVVTDQNLCDTIIPFTIVEPTEIVITINSTVSSCFGSCSGSADVSAAGGTGTLTYQWFNALSGLPLAGQTNPIITNLCPGNYYCIVTDDNGCAIQSSTITITELPQITTTTTSIIDATCGVCDGEAVVSAAGGSGGFVFTWVPAPLTGQGTPSVTGLCAGVNTANIIDAAGCTASIAVAINSIAIEVLTLDSVDVSCFGLCDGQAIANYTSIDPPYILEWFDNSTGLTTGI